MLIAADVPTCCRDGDPGTASVPHNSCSVLHGRMGLAMELHGCRLRPLGTREARFWG